MPRKPIICLIVGFATWLVAGCSPAVLPSESGTEPAGGTTTPALQVEATVTSPARVTPMPATEEPMDETLFPSLYDPAMQPLVDQAVADLSERLSLEPSQIEVLSAEAVVWPDSSYGCPQPGMEYLQVPQDGALIRLRAAGSEYAFHSGAPQGLFLCERTLTIPKPTLTQIDIVPTPGSEGD